MNEQVRQYLLSKFGPDFEKKSQEDLDEQNSRINKANLFAGIGDAIAGNKVGSSDGFFDQLKKQAKENTTGKIDKAKKEYSDELTLQKTQNEAALEDPNSQDSAAVRALLDKFQPGLRKSMGDEAFNKIKASQFPTFQKAFESDRDFKLRSQQLAQDSEFKRLQMMKLLDEQKNLPATMSTAATYAQRLDDANKQIEGALARGYDPTSFKQSMVNKALNPMFWSEDAKSMDQAQRNFINAVLRRESGSAIAQPEFDSANKQYFPQTGDTPAVLAQKKRNREVAFAGLRSEAGKAYDRLQGSIPPLQAAAGGGPVNEAAAGAKPVKKEYNPKQNKTRITYSDGSVKMFDGRQ
jgi:hypothetical protein